MYFNAQTQVLLDGEFVYAKDATGDLFSQTLHYGNGVFEGIRSYHTPQGAQIFKAREHYERFLFSAEKMSLPFEYSIDQLVDWSYELLERNQLADAYIRPLFIRRSPNGPFQQPTASSLYRRLALAEVVRGKTRPADDFQL